MVSRFSLYVNRKYTCRRLCIILFLTAAIAVIGALRLFIQVDGTIVYINWDSSVQIAPDGTEQAFSPDSYGNGGEVSGSYRFTGHLPQDLPAGSLIFETAGLDLTVTLNGKVIWRSRSDGSEEGGAFMAQAKIPLDKGTAGELTVFCAVTGSQVSMFPPLVRFIPDTLETAETTALANREAFPAGASALAFVLIFGIFLLGCLLRKPDWSLIPLLFAALGLTFFRLIQSQGYYFLPENIYYLLGRPRFGLFILLFLAIYLVMNRKRRFFRYLGMAAAWSGSAFLVCYLISLASGTSYARSVNTLISAYSVVRSFTKQRIREQGLLLENKRIMENYRNLETWTADSAARRHEINHQLTALDCLYQNGRYKEMGKLLARMQADQASRSLFPFTGNRTVNTILQNAAGQARRWGVRFHAYADLPDDLPLPETDLCALLMNMLDNALEAAAKVGEGQKKYVRVQMKVNGAYLAIRCENAYNGEIRTGGDGELLTTKTDRSVHGFGCRQMRQIAEKYESRLLFSFEDPHVFIVETALHIPENAH